MHLYNRISTATIEFSNFELLKDLSDEKFWSLFLVKSWVVQALIKRCKWSEYWVVVIILWLTLGLKKR